MFTETLYIIPEILDPENNYIEEHLRLSPA
jgi:hypothetical protein